jgi:hypothetical protein
MALYQNPIIDLHRIGEPEMVEAASGVRRLASSF